MIETNQSPTLKSFRLAFTQIIYMKTYSEKEFHSNYPHKTVNLKETSAIFGRNCFKNSEAALIWSFANLGNVVMLKRYKLGINARKEGIIKDLYQEIFIIRQLISER